MSHKVNYGREYVVGQDPCGLDGPAISQVVVKTPAVLTFAAEGCEIWGSYVKL
jgi:hypothetical protein